MSRDWKLYWAEAIVFCERIQRYTAGMTKDQLFANQLTLDAVLRNIELIGEATKTLPSEARSLAPHIAWRKMAGTRDFIAHAYFGVDDDVIWDIVENKVPELLSAMRSVNLP